MDEKLELSDRDSDALTLYVDGQGLWVTCTDIDTEVTIGPVEVETVVMWLEQHLILGSAA